MHYEVVIVSGELNAVISCLLTKFTVLLFCATVAIIGPFNIHWLLKEWWK